MVELRVFLDLYHSGIMSCGEPDLGSSVQESSLISSIAGADTPAFTVHQSKLSELYCILWQVPC